MSLTAPGSGVAVRARSPRGAGPESAGAGGAAKAPDVVEDGQSDRDHVLAEAAVGEARAGARAGDDVVVPEQVHVAEGLAADRRGRAPGGEAADADGLDAALAALVDVVAGGRAQRLLAQDPVQDDRHGARVAGLRRAGQARERTRRDGRTAWRGARAAAGGSGSEQPGGVETCETLFVVTTILPSHRPSNPRDHRRMNSPNRCSRLLH